MAKFRSSHSRTGRGGLFLGFRLALLTLILILFWWFGKGWIIKWFGGDPYSSTEVEIFYLPAADSQTVYHKAHFTLSYDEDTEQARWVAYKLSIDQLNTARVSRTDFFYEDLAIHTGSSRYDDYKGSGYTKGHLVPAADRAFSERAMEETFLMSNISPQTYHFNAGIWRELEEQVRDWARGYNELLIVTGPIFSNPHFERIGANGVGLPDAFFKVIMDATGAEYFAIGFVIPNQKSDLPLPTFAKTVDEVELLTGFDLFADLFIQEVEDSVESKINWQHWPFNEQRYRERVNVWNRR